MQERREEVERNSGRSSFLSSALFLSFAFGVPDKPASYKSKLVNGSGFAVASGNACFFKSGEQNLLAHTFNAELALF